MPTKASSSGKPGKKSHPKQPALSSVAQAIIRSVGVGIYLVQHGNFVYASPLWQKLTGYLEEVIGTYSLDHVHPDDKEMVREKAIKSLKGESSEPYEYRFIKRNGDIMWVLEMVTSTTYQGELATVGSFMDITESKRLEENLRQSEVKYSTLVEAVGEGYFEVDLAGNLTSFSDAFALNIGYSKEELLGVNYRAFTLPEYVKDVYHTFNQVFRTGEPATNGLYNYARKDGSIAFGEYSVFLKRDHEGNIVGFRGLSRDVTERKRMEEALRQSEEKYRTMLDEMDEGYFETDLAGNFTLVNEANIRHLGYSREELLGANYRLYTAKEDIEPVYKAFNKVYRTGKPERGILFKVIRKDGTTGFNETSALPLRNQQGEIIGFRGLARDITEHKQMEEALRRSEERYRTIMDEMDESYFETDLDGNYTFINDAIARTTGYSKEEFLKMDFRPWTHKDDQETVYKAFNSVYRTGQPVRNLLYRTVRKDGTMRFAETSAFPLRNQQGEIIAFRGIGRDVTERKRMEEALRQSEERYRTVLEEMEEWYFETDLAGNLTFFNDTLVRALGHSKEGLTGLNFRALTKLEDADTAYDIFNQVYQTGEPIKNFPHQLALPNGSLIYAEFSIFPQQDHEGKVIGFRGVGHDITGRKQIEQQLSHMATHDSLTGLPNRMLFTDRLKMALEQAKRHSQKLAVVMLDLDHFKNVNDSLGHTVGDQLLINMGNRLARLLRQSDTVARMGGDEFMILLPQIEVIDDAAEVAQKILDVFQEPFMLNGHKLSATTSMGVAIYPDDCQDVDNLLKNADIAMYHAKAHGRNNYQLFTNIKPN
jgi:diguanylate cyclase (GGDEF)-like protein/PAS domain S-box-containing protein